MITTLPLDHDSLAVEELSVPALMQELNLHQRPHWLLRKIMNALEQKRQSKGLGWSRAWNKYGLNIFRTHVHHREQDAAYLAPLAPLFADLLQHAPTPHRTFARELLQDPALMGFTFYHNHTAPHGQYEGLTLSFGRKVVADPSKRDRLDIVLEDRRAQGRVDGHVDRLRLYICPWAEYQKDRSYFLLEQKDLATHAAGAAQALYSNCVHHYHLWKSEPTRQWSHWSARYIDYFGPRSFIPVGSSFC